MIVAVEEDGNTRVRLVHHRESLIALEGLFQSDEWRKFDVFHATQSEGLQNRTGAEEVLHELIRWVGQDVFGRVQLSYLALVTQDRDPIPHLHSLVDVVGDEHDRLLELFLKPEELVLQAITCDRVDRSERLVHQQDVGVRTQGPRNTNTLGLATGKLGWVPVPIDAGIHRHNLEKLVDASIDLVFRPLQQPRNSGDVLGDRPVREQSDLLDHVAHATTKFVRVTLRDVFTLVDDPSR